MADELNAATSEGAGQQAAAPVSATTEPAAGIPTGSPSTGGTNSSSEPKDSRALGIDKGSDDGSQGLGGAGLLGQDPADEDPNAGILGAPEDGYKFEADEKSPVQLSGDMLDAFGKVAKELNLSQASAQKVVSAMAPAMTQHYAQMRKEWAAQSEGDPEFGGPAFKANLKSINRTYMDTTTEGLREVLMKTGLNSHPEVLRFFYRLNKERSEGKFITSAGSSDDRSGSDDFYKGMRP